MRLYFSRATAEPELAEEANSISMIEYPLDKGREEFQEGGYLFSPLLGVSLHTFWTKPESMGLHGLSVYKK